MSRPPPATVTLLLRLLVEVRLRAPWRRRRHDAVLEVVFELEKLFDFAFHELADGDAGPAGDDFGDVFAGDFLFEEGGFAEFGLAFFELSF